MKQIILTLVFLSFIKLSYAQSWKFIDSTPEKITSHYKLDTTVINTDVTKDKAGNIDVVGITFKELKDTTLVGYLF
ncbi:MAG: hypothetical protein EOO96_28385 [Pedobacter sp.]|nr:MAG: hypothetical protein EOO96_28385 [Pedobacter sp.]